MRRRNPNPGLTELWYRLKQKGYSRTVESLYRCMRREGLIKPSIAKKKDPAKPYQKMTHPGERVQIDVKVVPRGQSQILCKLQMRHEQSRIIHCARQRIYPTAALCAV